MTRTHSRLLFVLLLSLALLLGAACSDAADDATPDGASNAVAPTTEQVSSTDATEDEEPVETRDPEPTETSEPTATATLSPTPKPTNTPAPSPTPRPTNTPTPIPPTATPEPPPAPLVYSGSGANVIDIQKPGDPDDAVLAYVRGNAASGYFGVKSYDDAGEQVDLLVNTTDPYEGIVLLDLRDGQLTTRLEITADGDWYIEIRPLSSARRVSAPGTINGNGDEVFILDGDPDVAHIAGNADGNYFGVWAYGDSSDLLVNETDPFDGRVIVSRDAILFEVTAVGGWEITFE
jgi:hypothetical protein